MTKSNTISELIIDAMKRLQCAGYKSVTRNLLWNALKDSQTKDGSLKRASLSSCITSLIANKRLVIVPVAFDVQHFALPSTTKSMRTTSIEEENEIDEAAEILLLLQSGHLG